MKHLLKLLDLSQDEIIGLLDLADQLKYEKKHGIAHPHLQGKSVGLIFQNLQQEPVFPLKPVFINLADSQCSFQAVICRLDAENPFRILPVFFPDIWMES